MADTTALKNRIRAAIKANDNQEITGPVLQQSLLDMVDELNGATETEASQRQSGDNTLGQRITEESNARQNADSTLSGMINSETQRAQGAEQILQQNINTTFKGLVSKLSFNPVWVDGYYSPDGSYNTEPAWKRTAKIPVSIWLSEINIGGHEAVGTICFFEKDGTFISSVVNTARITTVPTIPSNAYYYTISRNTNDAEAFYAFESNHLYTESDFKTDNMLFGLVKFTPGFYGIDGVPHIPHGRFECTDYLDIDLVYIESLNILTNSTVGTICFFDKDKTFISSVYKADNLRITEVPAIPSNAKYFIVSKSSTDFNSINFKLNVDKIANEDNIPTVENYSENLFYDPNFEQGVGVIEINSYDRITVFHPEIEKTNGVNWLKLTKLSQDYRPYINLFTTNETELVAGNDVVVLVDYEATLDTPGGSYIGVYKNNHTFIAGGTIGLGTLSNKGTLRFDFKVPSDAPAVFLEIGLASTVGDNFVFKVSNLRVYSEGKRFLKIKNKIAFEKELTPKKNLFNKEDIVPNHYLTIDGAIIELNTIGYSNPIPVKEGQTYHTNVPHSICFYNMYDRYCMALNANMLNANNGNFTVPAGSGITHIRVNCYYSNLDTLQIEVGTVATTYEPFILWNKYLEANGNNISVDDETIGKDANGTIFVKDGGLDEDKLDDSAKAKLNRAPVVNQIGDISISGGNYIYLATDYLNADGNVSGQENTVAEWQAMIDACAVTGGTIFFPDGHYVCKPANGEVKYLVLKDGVILRGASRNGVTLELQTSDEAQFFRFATNANVEIDDLSIVTNLLNEYIEPQAGNMGHRIGIYVQASGVNLLMNNVYITAINLNNGYDITTDNFMAASAAYMLMSVAANNCKVVANNCYAESPAWGIFNVSSNSDLIWHGDLRCWYKCTGVHGTGARIIVHGNLTSYGSGSYACISCSGGHTIVNGNLYRIPEVDSLYSLYGSAIYSGTDDDNKIIVNGNIYTCSGVFQGNRCECEINGNIYCVDKDFTHEIHRVLFAVGEYISGDNTYFADVKFTGNISCEGVKPFGLFEVQGGHLEINGNSFTCSESVMTLKESGVVKLSGNHQVIKDRFIRMFAGKLFISGNYIYSANHEMIQVVGPAVQQSGVKEIHINNANFYHPDNDYDRFGNVVTTEISTGEALLSIHSVMEVGSKIVSTNVKTNGKFSEGVSENVEIHNTVASMLGTATKSNTLIDL